MNSVFKLIAKKELKICLFESASAGYIAYKISQDQYSGDVLDGGIVCYDLNLKKELFKIKQSIIDEHTAESPEVTKQLITNGKSIYKSDIYISCTGLLKRGGSETKQKPVGTFFYCIFYKNTYYQFEILTKGRPKAKLKTLYKNICKSLKIILKNN